MSTPEQPGADDATSGDQNVNDTQDPAGTADSTEGNTGSGNGPVDDGNGGQVAGVSRKNSKEESEAADADPPGDESQDPQGAIDLDSDGDPDGPEGQGLTDAEKAKAVGGFNAPDPAIYDASGGSTKDVLGGSGLPGSVSPGHGNDQ